MPQFYFIVLFLGMLTACQPTSHSSITPISGEAMTMGYRILIGQSLDQDQQNRVYAIIQNSFAEIDAIYNKWNPHSELSQLNRLEAKKVVPISPQLEQFLAFTGRMVHLSEGRFDPTIEPLQKLWKSSLSRGEEPTKGEIAAVMPAIGWDKIHFSNGTFYKDHKNTQLDLGGIAKGYCVDLILERIVAAGYPNAYVEWGGEIRTQGHHPDNRPWNIYITHFENTDPERALAHLSLHDEAIATSGDYLQYWQAHGVTYFHIFDAKTARPLIRSASSIASASVVAPTCAFADALATTAMLFSSIEEAKIWADRVQQEYPKVRFWFASRERLKDEG